MPEKRGGASVRVTCEDCYFRQELLCALDVSEVCPTFRATVGRARRPQAPRQAQLVPLPQVQTQPELEPVPAFAHPAAAAAAESAAVPFSQRAAESNFSIRDVAESPAALPAREVVQHQSVPVVDEDVAWQRAAAASRGGGTATVVVQVAGDGEPEQVALPLAAPAARRIPAPVPVPALAASDASTRTSRVAARVAQRYPKALSSV